VCNRFSNYYDKSPSYVLASLSSILSIMEMCSLYIPRVEIRDGDYEHLHCCTHLGGMNLFLFLSLLLIRDG